MELSEAPDPSPTDHRARATLGGMALYFLRLGALGFGGPVALAHHMRGDLVENRGWITEEEYDEGLAIATACPGPLAYQLAIYCGYIRFNLPGALAVAFTFALPPFVLVTIAAALYVRFSATWQLRALFYGVGPVIVALILKACWKLGGKTLKRKAWAWILAFTAALITVIFRQELVVMFLISGLLGILLFKQRPSPPEPSSPALPPHGTSSAVGALAFLGGVAAGPTAKLFLFFFKTGLLVFGSGLVIVPFLKAYVVDQYHWLNNRQFLDSVAIGMISPGPVVITATFVGYLLQGIKGATAATVGIFTPPVLFTVVATPVLRRYRKNPQVQGFIQGITSAVVGALVGTSLLVAQSAVGDLFTLIVALCSLTVVILWKKIPEPLLVLLGAIAGLAAFHWLHPAWGMN